VLEGGAEMLDKTMLVQDLTADEMPAYAVTTQAPAVLTADVTLAVVLVEVARVVALTEVVEVEALVLETTATGVLVLTTTGVVVAATEVLAAYVANVRHEMFYKYRKKAYHYTGSCSPGGVEAAACTGQLLDFVVTGRSPSRQASSGRNGACGESSAEFTCSRSGCSVNSCTRMISRIVAPQSQGEQKRKDERAAHFEKRMCYELKRTNGKKNDGKERSMQELLCILTSGLQAKVHKWPWLSGSYM
jgi:hypothetical protein